MKDVRKYEYRGKWYKLKELADLVEMEPSTLGNRIHIKNLTIEEAISLPIKKPKLYLFQGKYYTVRQIADILDIPNQPIYNWIKKGKSLDQAITYTAKEEIDVELNLDVRFTQINEDEFIELFFKN